MMLRRQSQQAGTCSYSSSYTIVSRLSIPNVLLAQGYNRSLLAAPGVKAVDWNGWHVTSIIEFALLFNFIFGFNITSYLYAYDTLSSSNWFKNPLISIDCIQKKKKKDVWLPRRIIFFSLSNFTLPEIPWKSCPDFEEAWELVVSLTQKAIDQLFFVPGRTVKVSNVPD